MLPILTLQKEINQILDRSNRVVLAAPTGSGKTTQVPQILAQRAGLSGQIVVLQPRRLATRLAAERVAVEMESPLGEAVGYQTRFERRVGPHTRIRFATEGLFLRQLQDNPRLEGVAALILDEFHERSLAADTVLGLLKGLQEKVRQDLVLVVMSATLDVEGLSGFLDCPALEGQGRRFEVETRYMARGQEPVWAAAAGALEGILATGEEGDVLIFMPGAYEIRRTIEACQRVVAARQVLVLPLHGDLPPRQQDEAVGPKRHRKVIVATNVAETSLTIDGIRWVIDSGLARVRRYDPRRGLDVLLVEQISRAAAEQRRGRAGRTAPGVCLRLWSKAQQAVRPARDAAEINRVDLAAATLQLLSQGIGDLAQFPWLEAPPPEALRRAKGLLEGLGALEGKGLSAAGIKMARLPMEPRLARLALAAAERGCLERALLWAALLEERDILERPLQRYWSQELDEYACDLALRERAWRWAQKQNFSPQECARRGVRSATCRRVEQTYQLYNSICRDLRLKSKGRGTDEDLAKSLLTAFYDRVAMRRDLERDNWLMAGQKRVELDRGSVAGNGAMLVALGMRETEAGRSGVRTVLSTACQIEPQWLEEIHPIRVEQRRVAQWNSQSLAVEAVQEWCYDGLEYRRKVLGAADEGIAADVLVERISSGELVLRQWDQRVEEWLSRVRCIGEWFPERGMLSYTEEDLALIRYEIIAGATRYSQIRDRPCLEQLQSALSWEDRRFVEAMAPPHLVLPRGVKMRLEYQPGKAPRGRAKIQDLYGLKETPRVAQGRQAVLLEILGPNFRPIQITGDLAGFWLRTYPEVKKELKRRYPKHEWR